MGNENIENIQRERMYVSVIRDKSSWSRKRERERVITQRASE